MAGIDARARARARGGARARGEARARAYPGIGALGLEFPHLLLLLRHLLLGRGQLSSQLCEGTSHGPLVEVIGEAIGHTPIRTELLQH